MECGLDLRATLSKNKIRQLVKVKNAGVHLNRSTDLNLIHSFAYILFTMNVHHGIGLATSLRVFGVEPFESFALRIGMDFEPLLRLANAMAMATVTADAELVLISFYLDA